MASDKKEKIGLIAGNRRFPLIFAQEAKIQGYFVVALAIKGNTSLSIKKYAHKVHWLDIREFSRVFEIFRNEGVSKVAMAGQINPYYLFNPRIMQDERIKALFKEMQDKKANTVFGLICDKLNKEGFELIDPCAFMANFLPKKGTLTKTAPDFDAWQDIYFGLDLAKTIANLDIGQTVAVKNKAIVAIEALEGTDGLIRRSGKIAGRGVTIVKVSRPMQDMRFDIPVVGLNTVKNLIRAGASCLAIEAEKTIFLDREASVILAGKKKIAIVAV